MPQPMIIVMVKAPRAGKVKTRLVPPLSESDAASLAACFAQDTVLNAQHVVHDVLVAYTPSGGRDALAPILPSDLRWFEQDGDNLGERLDSVAKHVFSLGFSPFVILGADSPTLPTGFIQEALNVLASGEADISLGPSDDGDIILSDCIVRSQVSFITSTGAPYRHTNKPWRMPQTETSPPHAPMLV